jgi:chromosome segregation ATPase
VEPDPVLEELKDKFKEHIDCIDGSLTEVVRKHEKQYLEAYNMYVKRKEVELKDLINNIYARDKNANLKDEKIATLEKQLQTMSKDAVSEDKQKEKLRRQIKTWKDKYEREKEEREFYHKSALNHKRKNKLLKVAVSRLQSDYEMIKIKFSDANKELTLVHNLENKIQEVQRLALGEEDDADSNIFLTKVMGDDIKGTTGQSNVRFPDIDKGGYTSQ